MASRLDSLTDSMHERAETLRNSEAAAGKAPALRRRHVSRGPPLAARLFHAVTFAVPAVAIQQEGGRVDSPQAMTFDDALAVLRGVAVVEIGCGPGPIAQAAVGIDIDLGALLGLRSGMCRIAGDARQLPLAGLGNGTAAPPGTLILCFLPPEPMQRGPGCIFRRPQGS